MIVPLSAVFNQVFDLLRGRGLHAALIIQCKRSITNVNDLGKNCFCLCVEKSKLSEMVLWKIFCFSCFLFKVVVKFSPPWISGNFLGQVPFDNPFNKMGFLDRSNSGGLNLTTTVSSWKTRFFLRKTRNFYCLETETWVMSGMGVIFFNPKNGMKTCSHFAHKCHILPVYLDALKNCSKQYPKNLTKMKRNLGF